ncbi:MAG: aldo/keto reductase [Bacteroidetes bacterium]|nr:aldo/keto reductase [Bacteroidota bacterium]
MKRRDFLIDLGITVGALPYLPASELFSLDHKKKNAYDIITLGKTGVKASRLAMGTGTNGYRHRSNQTDKLGVKGLSELLVAANDEGINFWDSADEYGSHPHLKEALRSVKRDKVVILTKTHARTAKEMKSDLDRFRKEIDTEYIDIILLHCLTDPDWPADRQGAMDELSRARESGIIRAHGVSCHSLSALQAAADSDWVQVDLARINPAGIIMDADVHTVTSILQRMHNDGKAVIGMKILGNGRLRNRIDECLKYVLNLDYIDAFTIGQENQDQMRDLVKRIPMIANLN